MGAVVTRSSLADKLADKLSAEWDGLSKSAAQDLVRNLFDTISDVLSEGNEVHIHRFGSFRTSERPARTGRNPRTGESIRVPARKVVRFAPSTTLVETVRTPRASAHGTSKGRK